MKSNSIYKIRDKNTGLFSKGGSSPRWGKKGKAWTSLGALRLHLRQYVESYDFAGYDWSSGGRLRKKNTIPDSWEILEFSLEPSSIVPAKDVMNY